jgi:flagellar basal-body rod protein FlgC
MYGLLDISTSGMIVQRTRLEAAISNLANAGTLRDANGKLDPYRRREVYVAAGDTSARTAEGRSFGAQVVEIGQDSQALPTIFDPTSPDAFPDGPYKGYVASTGINPLVEHVNALEAARAYEANVMAAEATKQMVASALRLLA